MRKFGLNLILMSSLFLSGCGLEVLTEPQNETRVIQGVEYQIQGNRITQNLSKEKGARILVLSDIHGKLNNEKKVIEKAEGNFDYITMLGDYISLPGIKPHYEEIYSAIEIAAKTNKPVFALNGNHDNELEFREVVAELNKKYPNVFDLTRERIVDLCGFNLISNFKGSDITFLLNGFECDEEIRGEILDYTESLSDDDKNIVMSHQYQNFENIFYGHSHEISAYNLEGKFIEEGEYSDSLQFNPGVLGPLIFDGPEEGSAGIVELKDRKLKYELLLVN